MPKKKEKSIPKEIPVRGGFHFEIRTAARYTGVFVAGILVTSAVGYWQMSAQLGTLAAQITPLRQPDDRYQFIDPLLGYNLPETIKSADEYAPLERDIKESLASQSSSAPDAVGVYFRDFSSGRWSGVNENAAFAPGSLMKVVLMIAYYEQAESDPGILQKTLAYSPAVADQLNGVPFETPSNLQVGGTYTVEQLIDSMIENSDNGAKNALLDNIDPKSLAGITTDLSLPYLDTTQNYDSYAITPKEYSVLLRVLYNATYLSRAYSEKALSLLAQANYHQGLIAGVPQGIAVAQKYGEAVTGSASAPEITLSNCGIVYYPEHPYILCVMTRGQSLADLTQTIANISKVAWDAVAAYANHE